MSIHYLSGKPGGGKSMKATKMIVDELATTQRTVVTNVPLKLDNLQDYLLTLGHKVDVFKRVRILTEDETYDFWRHRGVNFDMPPHPLIELKGEKKPDPSWDDNYSTPELIANGSVFFVIDEIHLFFNSRQWKDTGRWAIRYLSQHRHLGDDVICITQSVSNVDKQFRSLMQDITYLRNMRVEKWSIFAAPNKFTATTFLSVQPDGAKDTRQAVQVEDFTLDVKGLASCYSSTGGVGMPGMATADLGKRAKGIPFWFLFVFLGLGGAAFLFVVFGGGQLVTKQFFPNGPKPMASVTSKASSGSSAPQSVVSQVPLETSEPRFYISSFSDGAAKTYFCEDGTILHTADLKSFGADYVVTLDGRKLFRRAVPRQSQQVSTPQQLPKTSPMSNFLPK